MDKVKNWLYGVISGLVSKPEEIEIVASMDEQGVLFSVNVANEDMGKIIGAKGAISSNIRSLLHCVGYINDMRATMKIKEPLNL